MIAPTFELIDEMLRCVRIAKRTNAGEVPVSIMEWEFERVRNKFNLTYHEFGDTFSTVEYTLERLKVRKHWWQFWKPKG